MDDLVTWLRAQLDEDERVARAATRPTMCPEWACSSREVFTGDAAVRKVADVAWSDDIGAHIARHDPARVLAEVDAKRRILDQHRPADSECTTCCGESYIEETWDGEEERISRKRASLTWPCPTVRLLALPYANRRGYRDEWKP